ncbi:MAG: 4'-phosphopantetheinyl transferase superfamily protein [Planctomycetes bacterium]|nr:4'-phosphopantetheinyl transferase superfamily protein [Planctomycetota bacterium]
MSRLELTPLAQLGAGFGGGFEIGITTIVDARHALQPEEAQAVEHVTEARMREFSTGRAVAHELLLRLGVTRPVVGRSLDRSPNWPAGCVGSIAHTARLCIVVAARGTDYRSVGVDIEPAEPLERELFQTIAVDDELRQFPAGSRAIDARRLFVAKEAAYKCLHPVTGVFLDFHDVFVTFDGAHFVAAVRHPEIQEFEVDGVLHEHDGHFIALAALPVVSATPRSGRS